MSDAVSTIGQRLGVFRQAVEFLGVSLWIAWVLLIYSGEFYIATDNVYLHTTLCYLVSTTCVSLAFLVAGLRYRRAESVVFDRKMVVAGGLAGSLGTVGMMFIGRPVGLFALLIVSAAVTGLGTGVVALRACLAMGELSARNTFIVSAATLLQAFVIYLAVLSLPFPIAACMLIALPLLAGLHLSLHRNGDELPVYADAVGKVARPLWRMTAALFVLAVAFSISRGMYPNGLDISDFNDSRNYAAFGSMAFCALMLALALILPSGASFGQLGYWMVVAIVFVTTVFPVLGFDSAVSGVASTVANSALGVTAWALFGAISSLSRVSPLRVYGLGFSAFMFGSAVGWPLAFVAQIGSLGSVQYYVGFGLLLVVFLVVLTLFRQSDLAWMTGSSDEDPDEAIVPTDAGLDEPGAPPATGDGLASGELGEGSAGPAPTEGPASEGAPVQALHRGGKTSWKGRMSALADEYYLTERESDVFLLLAKGLNARAISDALGFSYNTARVHVRNIYMKLDVHSRDELLEFVAENDRRLKGMVPQDR